MRVSYNGYYTALPRQRREFDSLYALQNDVYRHHWYSFEYIYINAPVAQLVRAADSIQSNSLQRIVFHVSQLVEGLQNSNTYA